MRTLLFIFAGLTSCSLLLKTILPEPCTQEGQRLSCEDGLLSVCRDQFVEQEPCASGACEGDQCSESCGDATQNKNEGCDDGNTINGDGCDESCQLEICGDAKVDVGEECDDGNDEIADQLSDRCDPNCTEPDCGNGVVGVNGVFPFILPEECDDGNTQPGDGCDSQCQQE